MISLNGDSLTTVVETAYSMIKLIPNTSYLVEVQALDAAGNISDAATANFSTLAPPDFIPPTTPENLEASYLGNGSVALSWDASTDNIGVVNYRVYEGSSFKGAVTGTTYTVDGLVEGESYTFYVSAVDNSNNESAKAEATIALTGIGDDQLTAPRIWVADRCIHMETGSAEKVGVSVYNIQGSRIYMVELSRGQKMVREMETPGLYIVTTSADNQLKSHKIVIQ